LEGEGTRFHLRTGKAYIYVTRRGARGPASTQPLVDGTGWWEELLDEYARGATKCIHAHAGLSSNIINQLTEYVIAAMMGR